VCVRARACVGGHAHDGELTGRPARRFSPGRPRPRRPWPACCPHVRGGAQGPRARCETEGGVRCGSEPGGPEGRVGGCREPVACRTRHGGRGIGGLYGQALRDGVAVRRGEGERMRGCRANGGGRRAAPWSQSSARSTSWASPRSSACNGAAAARRRGGFGRILRKGQHEEVAFFQHSAQAEDRGGLRAAMNSPPPSPSFSPPPYLSSPFSSRP
jgi:hypothetical protein